MTSLRSLTPLGLAAAVLGLALIVAPGSAATELHIFLVVAAAGLLVAALAALSRERVTEAPSVVDSALAPERARTLRPEELERLERLLTIGVASSFDLHYRLRPAMREIAGGLLLRRGIDLDGEPERAHAALGDEVWAVVRPDRPAPDDRHRGGLGPAALERLIAGLEAVR